MRFYKGLLLYFSIKIKEKSCIACSASIKKKKNLLKERMIEQIKKQTKWNKALTNKTLKRSVCRKNAETWKQTSVFCFILPCLKSDLARVQAGLWQICKKYLLIWISIIPPKRKQNISLSLQTSICGGYPQEMGQDSRQCSFPSARAGCRCAGVLRMCQPENRGAVFIWSTRKL